MSGLSFNRNCAVLKLLLKACCYRFDGVIAVLWIYGFRAAENLSAARLYSPLNTGRLTASGARQQAPSVRSIRVLSPVSQPTRESFMNTFSRHSLRALVTLVLALASALTFAQKTQLLVYTALETDQLKAYADSFNKIEPNIELKWVRDSTGVITAKVLAEKANPQADVIMGVAATSMMVFDQQGLLLPYKPKGFDKLVRKYSDPKPVPAWVGMDAWGATVCFNVVEAAKRGIPKPESWRDLTKAVYKGQITMPAPPSSGTGFLDATAWLQMWGEKEGWKYMDAL